MAIRPPSDIVLDVARAADPLRSQMAMAKLSRMSSANPSDGDVFADLLGQSSSSSARATLDPEASLSDLRTRLAMMDGPGGRAGQAAKANRDFEGFVLQNFIKSVMPKNEKLFGRGTAGEVWRSMMAEQIGKQIAESGGIGIASRMLGTHAPGSFGGFSLPIRPGSASNAATVSRKAMPTADDGA